MNDEIRAKQGRALQRRCGKAVVHCQQGAGSMGDFGKRGNVAYLGQRVGRRFSEQELRVRLDRSPPGFEFGLRHKGRLHAEFTEFALQQLDRRAEYRARAHHMVARLQQAHQQQHDGSHARRCRQAGLGALQRRQPAFHHHHGWIGKPAVDKSLFLVGEAARGSFGIGVHKTAGQKQGLGVLAPGRGRQTFADGQGIDPCVGR